MGFFPLLVKLIRSAVMCRHTKSRWLLVFVPTIEFVERIVVLICWVVDRYIVTVKRSSNFILIVVCHLIFHSPCWFKCEKQNKTKNSTLLEGGLCCLIELIPKRKVCKSKFAAILAHVQNIQWKTNLRHLNVIEVIATNKQTRKREEKKNWLIYGCLLWPSWFEIS